MTVGNRSSFIGVPAGVDALKCQKSSQSLKTLNLQIVYAADPRPTFVVDVTLKPVTNLPVIVYSNPACDKRKDLFPCFKDAFSADDRFNTWVLSVDSPANHYRYGGTLWFGFVLHERWKVICQRSPSIRLENGKETKLLSNSLFVQGEHGPEDVQSVSHEASVGKIIEEIRIGELGRKRAAEEEQQCSRAVRNLREKLRSLESSPSRRGLSRASSIDSLHSASNQSSEPRSIGQANLRDESKDVTDTQSSYQPTAIQRQQSTKSNTSKVILPLQATGNSADSIALEKFQRLAEAVDVGFFDYDADGKLLHANESWYALSGHPRDPEQHTVLSFNKCVYPDDAELVMNQWTKMMKGQSVTFEMRWRKAPPPEAGPDAPDEGQWVLAACVPVIGEDGKVQSISGCTTDINAQKHSVEVALQRAEALERARASEERLARFAEVAPIAIFRFDSYKNIEYCNDRWFEMTGVPKTAFEDIVWPFGVHEDDVELCSEAWEKSITDRSIGQIEFRLRKEWHDRHGRRGQAWAYCTFFPEFSEDGSFNGLMGSLLDISHLKWAENTQKMRAEEALEAKRQQENFIDVTSHEMRNPLSAMIQCADSIMTSLDDISQIVERRSHMRTQTENDVLTQSVETGLDAVQTILSCAAHQRRIVDDILTLSKLDSNLLLITPVVADPIDMVQGVIKMFEMDSSKAEVDLSRELDPSFTDLKIEWLMLDPSRVSQILINLLGNAIKFTRSETTKKVIVKMSASLDPPSKSDRSIEYVPAETVMDDLADGPDTGDNAPVYLKIEVQDTGRGLTVDEKAKLFLRFSQASPKTHVQYGGSGLGLFISRKLTEMQGGEIGFASEADVGSTFAFYIKTRRVAPPSGSPKPFGPAVLGRQSSNDSRNGVTRNLSILLVEDNLVNQRVLGKQLERQGCHVFVAGHGAEALDFLKTTELWAQESTAEPAVPSSDPVRIDIVLMDIEMPVMGGLECTRKIREFEAEKALLKHLPIISISANARREQVNEAELAGVDDTITKPFRIKELMPKVNRLANIYA